MTNYEKILNEIKSDSAYLDNLDWGKQRPGHPEGSIRNHIAELESNLDSLNDRLSDEQAAKIRLLIHTHDTFKPNAKPGGAITDANSHASLARQFLAHHISDGDLLNMVQFHDEPYALWRKSRDGGDCTERLEGLLRTIEDWDLFLTFLIVDGCTAGKSTSPLRWFFDVIKDQVESQVDSAWIELADAPLGDGGDAGD